MTRRFARRIAVTGALATLVVVALHATGLSPRPLPIAAAAVAIVVVSSVMLDGESRRQHVAWPPSGRRTVTTMDDQRVRRLQQSIESGRRDEASGRMAREALRNVATASGAALALDIDTAPIIELVVALETDTPSTLPEPPA